MLLVNYQKGKESLPNSASLPNSIQGTFKQRAKSSTLTYVYAATKPPFPFPSSTALVDDVSAWRYEISLSQTIHQKQIEITTRLFPSWWACVGRGVLLTQSDTVGQAIKTSVLSSRRLAFVSQFCTLIQAPTFRALSAQLSETAWSRTAP